MRFYETIEQVCALLQREGRISYRALKREFALDDEYLADLKAELIDAKRVAVDEDGKVLVWVDEGGNGETEKSRLESSVQRLESKPILYTPQHLAERIRAEQAAMEARGVTDGERKTITALFADIKDSTALIEDLDPEDARRLSIPRSS